MLAPGRATPLHQALRTPFLAPVEDLLPLRGRKDVPLLEEHHRGRLAQLEPRLLERVDGRRDLPGIGVFLRDELLDVDLAALHVGLEIHELAPAAREDVFQLRLLLGGEIEHLDDARTLPPLARGRLRHLGFGGARRRGRKNHERGHRKTSSDASYRMSHRVSHSVSSTTKPASEESSSARSTETSSSSSEASFTAAGVTPLTSLVVTVAVCTGGAVEPERRSERPPTRRSAAARLEKASAGCRRMPRIRDGKTPTSGTGASTGAPTRTPAIVAAACASQKPDGRSSTAPLTAPRSRSQASCSAATLSWQSAHVARCSGMAPARSSAGNTRSTISSGVRWRLGFIGDPPGARAVCGRREKGVT